MRDSQGGRVGHMSEDAEARPECEVNTPMTPDRIAFWCAAPGMVEPGFVGFQGKALTRDAMRRLRFVVHAAGWLHSVVIHGRHCCYGQPVMTSFSLRVE